MNTNKGYPAEVRERAVRVVLEHERDYDSQRATIRSIPVKIGWTAETLRKWVLQTERDTGRRPGLTTDEREKLKGLEREVRELRRGNTQYSTYTGRCSVNRSGCLDMDDSL